jgi:hypothetical protein
MRFPFHGHACKWRCDRAFRCNRFRGRQIGFGFQDVGGDDIEFELPR